MLGPSLRTGVSPAFAPIVSGGAFAFASLAATLAGLAASWFVITAVASPMRDSEREGRGDVDGLVFVVGAGALLVVGLLLVVPRIGGGIGLPGLPSASPDRASRTQYTNLVTSAQSTVVRSYAQLSNADSAAAVDLVPAIQRDLRTTLQELRDVRPPDSSLDTAHDQFVQGIQVYSNGLNAVRHASVYRGDPATELQAAAQVPQLRLALIALDNAEYPVDPSLWGLVGGGS
jgi:hypothetical protein